MSLKNSSSLNSVDINNRKVYKELDNKNDIGHMHITYKASGYYINITMFNDTVDWEYTV
jgi:hypothetical protein